MPPLQLSLQGISLSRTDMECHAN